MIVNNSNKRKINVENIEMQYFARSARFCVITISKNVFFSGEK